MCAAIHILLVYCVQGLSSEASLRNRSQRCTAEINARTTRRGCSLGESLKRISNGSKGSRRQPMRSLKCQRNSLRQQNIRYSCQRHQATESTQSHLLMPSIPNGQQSAHGWVSTCPSTLMMRVVGGSNIQVMTTRLAILYHRRIMPHRRPPRRFVLLRQYTMPHQRLYHHTVPLHHITLPRRRIRLLLRKSSRVKN
jgi:hypothetical protein